MSKGNKYDTPLTQLLNMEYPIIMAPMFLVSNIEMTLEAAKAGIAGCIPALNWRTEEELVAGLTQLKNECKGPWGINLIVNKSNVKLGYQIKAVMEICPDFLITSLGNPKEVIERAHEKGIKVFCDVSEYTYAEKVAQLKPDAMIAVNKEAGGHCGSIKGEEFIAELTRRYPEVPIISAGGVGDSKSLTEKLNWGAAGVSVGSPFIATTESPVSQDYKQACVNYGADDIVLTTKISGTPCTVINTPYVQKIGTKQNWLERMLSKNKRLKKWVKIITYFKGMKSVKKAAMSATYKTVWCAGPSIEYTKTIRSCREVVKDLVT